MRETFFDRSLTRALRFAFVGGLIGLQSIACSSSTPSDTGEPVGGGGTDTAGSGGDAQGTAGAPVTTGMGGGQSAGGNTGSGGTVGAGGAGGSSVPIVDAGPRTMPLKIMALGDSTTSASCFRAELAKLLDKSHPKDYQFVGTINNDAGNCGYTYDRHCQGMGGYLVSSTSGAMNTHNEAPTWAAVVPDVILLHFATNDAWNSIAPPKILAAYTYLVGEFRKTNPRVTIVAAQLIPLDPREADGGHSCSACPGSVKNLNDALPAWVTATNTATSRVILVDQWTGYSADTDSRGDGVHPGPSGSVKMGAKWDEAVEPLF